MKHLDESKPLKGTSMARESFTGLFRLSLPVLGFERAYELN